MDFIAQSGYSSYFIADNNLRIESTNLSCALADQGIKIRIRKDVRVRKRNIDPAWFQPLPPEQQYAPIEEPRSEGSDEEGDGARHGRDSKRARVGDASGPAANNAPPPPSVIPAPGAPGWGPIDPNLGNAPPQTSAAGPPPSQPPQAAPTTSGVPNAPENAQYDSRAYAGHSAQQQQPPPQPQQHAPPPPAPSSSSSSSGHAEYHHPPPPHVMQHPGHGHAPPPPPPPPGNMYAPYGQPQWGPPPVPQAPYAGYHQQAAYDHHAHQHQHQHQPPPSHHQQQQQQQQQQHRGPPHAPPPQQGHYTAPPPAPGPQPPMHYGQPPPPPPYGYYDVHGQYIPPAPAPGPAPTQQGQGQAPGSPHQRAKEGAAGSAYSASPPGVQMMPPHPAYAGQEYYGRPPPPPAPQAQQQDTRGAPPPANRGYQQQPSPYPPSAGQQAPPPQHHQHQQQQHGMGHYMGHPPPHHQGYVYPQGTAPDPYQQWNAGQYAFGGYGRPPMSNGQWPGQPPAANGVPPPPPPPPGQAGPSSLQQAGPADAYAAPQHQVDRTYQHQAGAAGGYVRPGPDDGSGRRTPPAPSISVQARGYGAQQGGGANNGSAGMVGAPGQGVMSSPERRMSTNTNGSPAGSAGAGAAVVGMSPDRIQLPPLRANNNASPPPPAAGVGGPYAPYGLNRSNSSYGPGSKKNPLSIGSIISDES